MPIADDFLIDQINKRIYYSDSGSGNSYTINELYSYLQDTFDEVSTTETIRYDIPMSAQTPTEYTLINSWFINEPSFQKLKSGAITTSGWDAVTNNEGIRVLTFGGTYISAVSGDIGKPVAYSGGTPTDSGTLLAYDNTLKKWWVRVDDTGDTFANTSTAIVITGGTGTGILSVASTTGEAQFSNIYTLGTLVSGTTLDVYQNNAQIIPFWSSDQINILVKVKEAGVEIDSGNLTVLARKYSTLYDHYVIDASTGRNAVPLASFNDTNNQTAEGTVGAIPYINITISTFGAKSQDLSNGNGPQPYEVEINCATLTLAQVYEYLKYVTRTGSGSTLNGVNGEYYTAVGDIRFDYYNEGGGGSAFSQGELITGTGGGAPTGYLVSLIDAGTTGTMVLRNVHGTFTTDQVITGGTTGRTAKVTATPDPITQSKQAPFGTFAGGNFFGARGVWIYNMASADATKYSLKDSTNATQNPPNVVPIIITVKDEVGTVVQNARVAVYKTSDMTELNNELTDSNGVAETIFTYPGSAVPVIIRVRKSSAAPKYISVETSGTITSTGLSATVTFVAESIAESTTNATIAGDFTVNTTTKTIRHVLGETPTYTTQEFYTWLMDYFDESGFMDDTIPMTAQTPTEFTLVNGWFFDDISTQFLYGGAIQTSGWTHPTNTTGIRILTLATITGVDDSDLGTAVVGQTTTDSGVLVDYNTILKKLWVRTDAADDDFNTAEDINVNGSLAGATGGAALTGETIWSNIFTLGTLVSGTTMDVYQDDAQITPFWTSGHIDILVKVKEASVETDSGNLTVLARKYSTLYDHFVIDASTGRNPVPLAAFTDTNNQTAEGTVAGYSDITITFGHYSYNLGNGNGARDYDAEINCAGRVLTQVYEYLKYVTRTGSGSTLNGVNGEYYTAVGDIRLNYTGETSGPFVQGNAITSSGGGSGYIVSLIDNGATGTLVIRNVHGTFADTNTLTSSGTTATISGTPDSIAQSKQAPFGTFAGGKFFGARGVKIYNMHADDANSYVLTDSTNTPQSPPATVSVVVSGLSSGDRVSVFRTTGDNYTIYKDYILSHATANSTSTTLWQATATIPSDTPSIGFVRLRKSATGVEERIAYTSWSVDTFTLSSAHSGGYGTGDSAYVPYIDEQAPGTSISKGITYNSNRYVVTVVRIKGIVPFTVKGQLTSAGYSATAIRTTDSIVQ